MKKLEYTIDIQAPKEKVYEKMIGIDSYKIWTAEFNPTSNFEGNWKKGEKIYFTGEHEGKKGGMIAEVVELIPNEFISLHHVGMLDDGKEIIDPTNFEGWGDALENYAFSENNEITTLKIEVDVHDDYVDYFSTVWPKALQKLKQLGEEN